MQYEGDGLDRVFKIGPSRYGDVVDITSRYSRLGLSEYFRISITETDGNEVFTYLTEEQMDELVMAYAWLKQEGMKNNG